MFIHEPNSDYYNDICNRFTTENGTDIILSDRKKEFNIKNFSICENNCIFIGYNLTTKKVLCECDIQDRSTLQLKDIINSTKLLNNFIDIKSTTNLEVLKCYRLLFSKDGLIQNIGSYILSIIFLILIISIILFYLNEYNIILHTIDYIIYQKEKYIKNNSIENKNMDTKNQTKEKANKKKIINKNNNIIKNKSDELPIKVFYYDSSKSSNKIEINNSQNLLKSFNKPFKDNINLNKENEDKGEKNNKDNINNYIDYEVNLFSYKKALEIDKRSFFSILYLFNKKKTNINIFFLY